MTAKQNKGKDSDRLKEIQFVMKEKDAIVNVAQEIIDLLGDSEPTTIFPSKEAHSSLNKVMIRKKILELLNHLSNMAGFCDKNTRNKIHILSNALNTAFIQLDSSPSMARIYLTDFLPFATSIQVDFNKRPFKTIGLDIEILKQKIKGRFER